MKRTSSNPSALSESLQRHLNAYALAASAAGVGVLALAQPAEARIIYTKTHKVIGINGVYPLDLNHDGTDDFLIQQCCGEGSSSINSNGLLAKEAWGNAVQGTANDSHHFAAPLKAGAPIGAKQPFISGGYNGEILASVTHCCTTGSDHYIGLWQNVKNRYLGLRFKIDGKTHYGWARLSVQLQRLHITGLLTGYAYETVPNKGIVAGQTAGKSDAAEIGTVSPVADTSGSDPSVVPASRTRSASLGKLSQGSAGRVASRPSVIRATQQARDPSSAKQLLIGGAKPLVISLFCLLFAISAHAQTYEVLHRFTSKGDGVLPWGGVILNSKDSLFGTTEAGGAFDMGTVFEIDAQGKEIILHSFWGGDGLSPAASLIQDVAGNLYGTTTNGGTPEGGSCEHGCGAVFKLDTQAKETVLYAFTGGSDGRNPGSNVVRDKQGNFYGTTAAGGDLSCNPYHPGCGVVYKLDTQGKETVLHAFTDSPDGALPSGGLIRDRAGNLYGVSGGGAYGWGAVFKVDKSGKESILYSFTGGSDGSEPSGPLVQGRDGNLYGETIFGGNLSDCSIGETKGCGLVFKLDGSGNETVLYAFTGTTDGAYPVGGLVRDATGNLYGANGDYFDGCGVNCGTIFQLKPNGTETVLHTFAGGRGGMNPFGGVVMDQSGNLYGTTPQGGDLSCGDQFGCGLVFKLTP